MKSLTEHIKRASLAVVALSSVVVIQGAYAAGTLANTDISNQAKVDYQVGGVIQTQIPSNTTTFKVDRKVNVTVGGGNTTDTVAGANATNTPPGIAVLFTVTNTGNGADTFNLVATNQAGDDFDVTAGSFKYYRDDGATVGTFDATDTLIVGGSLSLGTPDAVTNVFVVADIPTTPTNNQNAVVKLTATSTSTATGVGVVDDPTTVQVVIVNQSSNANDTFHIKSAQIAVTKSFTMISDPVLGISANAKAIPQAVVEYTITVTNNSTTTAASSLVVTDNFAATTTYVLGTISKTGGSAAAPTDANVVGNALSVTVGTLAASATATVKFRVTIN
jgi:Domain of unknown function DUF11